MPPKKNPTVDPSLAVNNVLATPVSPSEPANVLDSLRSPKHKQPAELMACLTRITLTDLNELQRLKEPFPDHFDQASYNKIRKRVRLFLSSQRDQLYGQRLATEVAPKLHDLTFMDRWAELIYQTTNELLALKSENVLINVPAVITKMIGIVSASYRTATKEHQPGLSPAELDSLQQDMNQYLTDMARKEDLAGQLQGLVAEKQALDLFKAKAEEGTFASQERLVEASVPIAEYQAVQSEAEISLANKTPTHGEVLSTPTRQHLARVALDVQVTDDDGKTMLDMAIELEDQELIEDVLLYAHHIDTAQPIPADSRQTRLISLSLGVQLCLAQKDLFSAKPRSTEGVSDMAMQTMIRYANEEALLLLLKKLGEDYPQQDKIPEGIRQALQQRRDENIQAAQFFAAATQCFAKTLQRYVVQYFKKNDSVRREHYWKKLQEELQIIKAATLKSLVPQTIHTIRDALLKSETMRARLTEPGCFDRGSWTENYLKGMRLMTKKINPTPLTDSLLDQVRHSVEQKRGMESRYLLAQKVFGKVLRYLDKQDAWHIKKRQDLLSVINQFALGEIKTAQDLMTQLSDQKSALYARQDDKHNPSSPSGKAKPSRSFDYVQDALKKYAHLLEHIQHLPRPRFPGLIQGR